MTWIFHILSIRVHDLAIPPNLTKFLKINPIIQSFPISKLPISPEERHKMGSLCTITNWSRLSLLLSDFCLSLLKILLLYPKFLFKMFLYFSQISSWPFLFSLNFLEINLFLLRPFNVSYLNIYPHQNDPNTPPMFFLPSRNSLWGYFSKYSRVTLQTFSLMLPFGHLHNLFGLQFSLSPTVSKLSALFVTWTLLSQYAKSLTITFITTESTKFFLHFHTLTLCNLGSTTTTLPYRFNLFKN